MTEPFPLIVGCGRSGTTLLRNILDAHSQLAVAHEAHFLAPMARKRDRYEAGAGFDVDTFVSDLYDNPNFRRQGVDESELTSSLQTASPDDFASAVRTVYAMYARAQGKPFYGDKTPGYVRHIALLAQLFAEASFIHIVRDGRDVALAYLDREEWGPRTVGEAALYWRRRVEEGRRAGQALGPGRYCEVKYESLVDEPETEIRRLCDFLGLEFEPDMLAFHASGGDFATTTATPEAFTRLALPVTKGLRDWRDQMSEPDVALFEAIAGDSLEELGYERSAPVPTLGTRARALGAHGSWFLRRARARLPSTGSAR